MDVDQVPSNPSTHDSFDDVLSRRLSRRTVMVGGLATAAVGFLGARTAAASAPDAAPADAASAGAGRGGLGASPGFAASR